MSEVSVDIRIFPEKEMLSVDMAEVLDAAVMNNGVIQGCGVTLTNGVLSMASGRIVVGGRLGVVTGGTIPIPSDVTVTETCWLMGVCDLSAETPFYITLANQDMLDRLQSARATDNTFNISNGLDYMTFGTCKANPSTGLVSDWTTLAQGQPKKGFDRYSAIIENINNLRTELTNTMANKMTWKPVRDTDVRAGTWVTIPDSATEIYVAVFVVWDSARKVCVDFHVPTVNALFNVGSGQTQTYHVNHWGTTYDGYVRIATMRDTIPHKYVKLLEAYSGETDVTSSTYCRIYYR